MLWRWATGYKTRDSVYLLKTFWAPGSRPFQQWSFCDRNLSNSLHRSWLLYSQSIKKNDLPVARPRKIAMTTPCSLIPPLPCVAVKATMMLLNCFAVDLRYWKYCWSDRRQCNTILPNSCCKTCNFVTRSYEAPEFLTWPTLPFMAHSVRKIWV